MSAITKKTDRGQPRQRRSAEFKARVRSCVGCRERTDPASLVRWVVGADGLPSADLARTMPGRGAWLHPTAGCLKLAKAGFSRSLRRKIPVSQHELSQRLAAAANRRSSELLRRAAEKRALTTEPAAVRRALGAPSASLLIAARDRKTTADVQAPQLGSEQQQWIMEWGSRAELGQLAGQAEADFAVVLDERLSLALSRLDRMTWICQPSVPEPNSSVPSTEVG